VWKIGGDWRLVLKAVTKVRAALRVAKVGKIGGDWRLLLVLKAVTKVRALRVAKVGKIGGDWRLLLVLKAVKVRALIRVARVGKDNDSDQEDLEERAGKSNSASNFKST